MMSSVPRFALVLGVVVLACKPQTVDHDCDASQDDPFVVEEQLDKPELAFQVCDSVAVDLDLDGDLDFIAANHIEPGFGYSLTNAARQFEAGVAIDFTTAEAGNSAGIVAADYNGDGKPDVANSNHNGTVTVRMNATVAGMAVDFPDSGETTVELGLDHGDAHGFAGVEGGLVSADFDGDGKPDIATANLSTRTGMADAYTATVLINQTAPGDALSSWSAPTYLPLPAPAISAVSDDFNQDGKPDLATSITAGSALSVFANTTTMQGSPTFATRVDVAIPDTFSDGEVNPAGAGPTNPVAGDFNGDALPDLASANWNVDTVTVFANTSDAGGELSFELLQVVRLCFNPLVVRAGDIDLDGDDDLIVIPLDLVQPISFAVIENQRGDANADPDAPFELIRTESLPKSMERPDSFTQWLADRAATGNSPGVWFTSSGVLSDFDGDGDPDIAITVAHGSFVLDAQPLLEGTTDILKFVEPIGPMSLAEQFLPDLSRLLHYVTADTP